MNEETSPEPEQLDRSPRRFLRVGAVLVVLFLPVAIILLMRFGSTQHFKVLPIYGEREARAPGDTVYHTLAAVAFPVDSLQTQFGAPWATDSLRGRIHVADFFFTYCPGICKKLSASMQAVQKDVQFAWDKTGDVRLVSYSIDPRRDSLPRLREYAKRYEAKPGLWTFVRGPLPNITPIAMRAYLLPLQLEGGMEDGITHSEMLVLVDPDLRVRGFYNGLEERERKRLTDEIKVLRHEYRQKHRETGNYPRFALDE